MTDATILLDAFKQKPAAAIDYIKNKGYAFSWDWFDTWKDAHARAFTVAKVAKLDLLRDIRAEVERAIEDGITFAEFKKSLMPKLQKKGWWGKKEIVDNETGETTEYMAGSPRRLETIYKTNVQTAYMAGRYKGQMDAAADLPYLQYIAVNDRRTRDSHRELHGMVFKADDPFWNEFYPPNGWGCRCRVRSLTERQVQRMGVGVEDSTDKVVHGTAVVGKGANAKEVDVTGYRMPSGKTMWCSPGWDYNVGSSTWMPDLTNYNFDDARAFITAMHRGPAYQYFINAQGKIKGRIPVGVLPEEYRKEIGAKTNIVALTSNTLATHKKHFEFIGGEYLSMQRIIEEAQRVIISQRNTALAFINDKGRYYFAVIENHPKDGLTLRSLRITKESDIKKQTKKALKVIKDELKI